MDTHRRALSAAGDPGGRRHSARSVVRGAEEHHAPLQGRVLRLQGRRGSAQVQPVADRSRFHQEALRDHVSGSGTRNGEIRRRIARFAVLCACWRDRCDPLGGAGDSAVHRVRPVCDHAVAAGVGIHELPSAVRAAAARRFARRCRWSLTVVLIALSHFKFGILQLTLTFLDFLIIDRDTFSFLLSVFPRLQMRLIVAGLVAVPLLWLIWRFDPFRVRRRSALSGWWPRRRADRGDGGRIARAGLGAVPGRQSHLQPGALGRGGGIAAGFDRMDRGRSAGERPAQPRAGRARCGLPALPSADACDTTAKRPHIIMLLDESSFDVTSAPGIKVPAGYADYFKSSDGKQRTMIAEVDRRADLVHRIQRADRPVGALVRRSEVLRHADRRRPGDARTAAGAAALRLQDHLALSDLWRLPRRAHLPEGRRRRAVHRHGRAWA